MVSLPMKASLHPGDIIEEPLGVMLSSYLPRIDGFAVHIKAIALQGRPGASEGPD